jgi:hypothetical protein
VAVVAPFSPFSSRAQKATTRLSPALTGLSIALEAAID